MTETPKPPPADADVTGQVAALEEPAAQARREFAKAAQDTIDALRSFRASSLQRIALAVDDDPSQQRLLKRILAPYFARVDIASTFTEAKMRLQSHRYDFIVCDMRLGQNGSGADVAVQVRHRSLNRNVPVVLISAEVGIDTLREWSRYSEADAYISKFDMLTKLPKLVNELLEK